MKYFFSTLVTLISVLVLTNSAWAMEGGSKGKGIQAIAEVFANQFSTNNGTTTTTTTEIDGQGEVGYGFGKLYLGGTIFNSSQSSAATTTTTQYVTWYGPTVGVTLDNFRILGTYIAASTANLLNGATLTALSSGTGFAGSISYTFYVSPKIFIAPVIDYYTVTYTSSTPAIGKNFTVTHLAPFLGLGFDF